MNNQISGLPYDGAGNVLVDNYNSYLYDAEGRICAVQNKGTSIITQYIYNASGTRVARGTLALSVLPATCPTPTSANLFTLTNMFLLDQGGDQVTELDGTGTWKHTNAWQGGHLTVTYDPLGEAGGPYLTLPRNLGAPLLASEKWDVDSLHATRTGSLSTMRVFPLHHFQLLSPLSIFRHSNITKSL